MVDPFRIRNIPLCSLTTDSFDSGLALFISKLFIGSSESPWNLKVFVL
jgi:hypothetical protein